MLSYLGGSLSCPPVLLAMIDFPLPEISGKRRGGGLVSRNLAPGS